MMRNFLLVLLGGSYGLLAAAGVFVCGILVDMVRKVIFDLLHRGLMRIGLYRRGISWIESADRVFGTNSGGKNG